jgi:hypothetical protein
MTIQFLERHHGGSAKKDVACVVTDSQPCLYHGALEDVTLGPIEGNVYRDVGTLRFPRELCGVREVFLLFHYEVYPRKGRCERGRGGKASHEIGYGE